MAQAAADFNRRAIEAAAQGVLDARAAYPDQSLAQLYDPLTMPEPLRQAHKRLDRVVDRAYRARSFTSEAERVAHLFRMHAELAGGYRIAQEGADHE